MRLTEDEITERKKRIVLTAFHLFCERGIDNVTMIEIAGKAEVGETTVYRYFKNKTKLVLEAFLILWDFVMDEIELDMKKDKDYNLLTGYEQIVLWIESLRQLYTKYSDFVLFSYEAKLYLLRHGVKLNKYQLETLIHTTRTTCINALEKGRTDGSICIEGNSEDFFFAMWGAIRGYIVKIVIYDDLYGKDSLWESRYGVVEQGMLSALRYGWFVPK